MKIQSDAVEVLHADRRP